MVVKSVLSFQRVGNAIIGMIEIFGRIFVPTALGTVTGSTAVMDVVLLGRRKETNVYRLESTSWISI